MYRSNYLGLFTHFYFEACVLLFFSNNNLTNDHIQLLNVRPLSFIGCVVPMFQLSTILVQFADSLRKNAPTQVRKYKEPDAPPYSKSYPTLKTSVSPAPLQARCLLPSSKSMKPKSTVTKMTTYTSTVTTSDSGKCHPCTTCSIYVCVGDGCKVCDECEYAAPPTLTVVKCDECEGGYTTSTCCPDVTVTVTACNTGLTSAATSVSQVPFQPSAASAPQAYQSGTQVLNAVKWPTPVLSVLSLLLRSFSKCTRFCKCDIISGTVVRFISPVLIGSICWSGQFYFFYHKELYRWDAI